MINSFILWNSGKKQKTIRLLSAFSQDFAGQEPCTITIVPLPWHVVWKKDHSPALRNMAMQWWLTLNQFLQNLFHFIQQSLHKQRSVAGQELRQQWRYYIRLSPSSTSWFMRYTSLHVTASLIDSKQWWPQAGAGHWTLPRAGCRVPFIVNTPSHKQTSQLDPLREDCEQFHGEAKIFFLAIFEKLIIGWIRHHTLCTMGGILITSHLNVQHAYGSADTMNHKIDNHKPNKKCKIFLNENYTMKMLCIW